MTKLYIKAHKPFVEKIITAKGVKDSVILGIKTYTNNEIDEVRKTFQSLLENVRVTRLLKEIDDLKQDDTISISDAESRLQSLYSEIDSTQEDQKDKLHAFYRGHILFLKSAYLAYEDAAGKKVDVSVTDTRDAKPLEFLWESAEECLPVLLDVYFDSPYYRDSLITSITETIFNYSAKENERKN